MKDSVKERDKCGCRRGELTAGGGESSPRLPKAEPSRARDMTDVPARAAALCAGVCSSLGVRHWLPCSPWRWWCSFLRSPRNQSLPGSFAALRTRPTAAACVRRPCRPGAQRRDSSPHMCGISGC